MILAEELFLCAIPDDGLVTSPKVPVGVGGAIAAELVIAGRIRIDEDDWIGTGSAEPTGDELLDAVAQAVREAEPRSWGARWFVGQTGRTQFPNVRQRVIDGGLVTVEPGKKRKMWFDAPDTLRPTPAGEEPRARLRAVLLGQRQPDPREAVLAGLAAACDLVRNHVPKEQRKEATARAETLAESGEIPTHVRDAIRGAQSATASATLSAQGH